MKWLVASTAAIALAASGALAQPGKGDANGNGKGNGNGNVQSGQERGKGDGNRELRDRGNGNAQAQRGNGNPQAQAQRGNEGGNRNGAQADRGNGNANRAAEMRPDRGNGSGNANRSGSPARAIVNPGNGNGNAGNINHNRPDDRAGDRAENRRDDRDLFEGPARYVDRDDLVGGRSRNGYTGLIKGCPPGLARKYNGCRPPGQVRKDGFVRRASYSPDWWGLSGYDGRYRYDSGYLLNVLSDGRIGSYLPLLGGALSLGHSWPNSYGYSNLSPYYVDYYDLGQSDYYRYADDVVYRLDPETSAITSIAALLTGDDIRVGQPMPAGYNVYNVPPSYRDRYYDGPEANYRYSDGYIYQVDPETQLVAAAIELLAT